MIFIHNFFNEIPGMKRYSRMYLLSFLAHITGSNHIKTLAIGMMAVFVFDLGSGMWRISPFTSFYVRGLKNCYFSSSFLGVLDFQMVHRLSELGAD